MPQRLLHALVATAVLGPAPAALSQEADAIPVTQDTTYLRLAPAADYWTYSHFVAPQPEATAAALTAVVNGLRAVAGAGPVTQEALIAAIGGEAAAEGLPELLTRTAAALDAGGLRGLQAAAFRPVADDEATHDALRNLLETNETAASDVILVQFDQGAVTGGPRRMHVALVGAYDLISDRVLILEVDEARPVPYWTSSTRLLQAMLGPVSGGLIHIHPEG